MPEMERLQVRGWEVLRLTGERLVVELVPELGGTVTALRRADGASLLWSTPWGLRPRGGLRLPGSSEAQMLDTSPGGWHTVFPNGGDTAVVLGAEWGFDGEARLTPMEAEATEHGVRLTGSLVRSPFTLSKTFSLEGDTLTLTETVRSHGGESVEVMWGSQLMLGGDLVGPGTTVSASASTVRPDPRNSTGTSYDDVMPWPRAQGGSGRVQNLGRLPGPDAGETRLVYLTDFDSPAVTVTSPDRSLALELTWDAEWPYAWYRLEAGGRAGYPWWSAGYFLALTPGSSWPAHGLHEARRAAGTTVWMPAGEEQTRRVSLRVR